MYEYVCTRRECMNGNNVRGEKKNNKTGKKLVGCNS